MILISLACYYEQLFCCEQFCPDVVNLIVKSNFFVLITEHSCYNVAESILVGRDSHLAPQTLIYLNASL